MGLRRSFEKRASRMARKINLKYWKLHKHGKHTVYHSSPYSPKFYILYIRRIFWLALALILLTPSYYEKIRAIVSSQMQFSNKLYVLVRAMFGYKYNYIRMLLPFYRESRICRKKRIDFRKENLPDVSIVIPVYNNLSYTFNCLRSIQERVSDKVSYEVVVIDDCSRDKTRQFFENNTSGIIYLRNEENIGYILSTNKASHHCRGRYICLLNNDTEILPGWLESMFDLIEKDENIGCVGSKLVYKNNLLQEAGGIIFMDANGSNYGRGDDPDADAYNYIREVDYCSAASLLFRKNDFKLLGRFDTRFAPAYYEDTDICFSFRHILRKKVVYQPLSAVIHFEGISSGVKIKKGNVKYYQLLNKEKFFGKWQAQLLNHHLPINDHLSARRLLVQPSILVIDATLPFYNKDSGSLRIYRIIKIFIDMGMRVIYAPYNTNKEQPYYTHLISMGVEVRTGLLHKIREDMGSVATQLLPAIKYIWVARPEIAYEFLPWLLTLKNTPWIYDTVDLHHLRLKRQAELNNDNSLLKESLRIKEIELQCSRLASATVAITEKEKEVLKSYHIKNVHVISNVHTLDSLKNAKPFHDRHGLLFIGGYDHKPNVDAALWLVKKIMPIVWQQKPFVRLFLLGSKPPKSILQLADERVIVPGFIPEVQEYFYSCRMSVSPLRYGAGMKGKIGQSMEYGLPVISTSIGAEGMHLVHGVNALIADDHKSFAAEIIALYDDAALWERLQQNAADTLKHFDEAAATHRLSELFSSLEQQKKNLICCI